ncbi:MAG: hypothetical protein DRJ47_02315 [Thermoprotei archaeon]|nr:MAG: hypothetical protein DRJ47_02315 [Thermoprotei archaeon]
MVGVSSHLTLAGVEFKLLRIYIGEEVEESKIISKKCPRCLAVVPLPLLVPVQDTAYSSRRR